MSSCPPVCKFLQFFSFSSSLEISKSHFDMSLNCTNMSILAFSSSLFNRRLLPTAIKPKINHRYSVSNNFNLSCLSINDNITKGNKTKMIFLHIGHKSLWLKPLTSARRLV